MCTFTLNNKWYQTDAETLAMLRSIMPQAVATGDHSAVITVLVLGEMAGRIKAVGSPTGSGTDCYGLLA